MSTTGNANALTAEEIERAADYVQLVFQSQGHDRDWAALEEFHRDGYALAKLMSAFGTLLLSDHITLIPEDHPAYDAEEDAPEVLTEVAIRDFQHWCLQGATGWMAAVFLIEYMQEQGDQTLQILADVRQAARYTPQDTAA
ncbi:hypothetical protein [Streptomyces sp. NPDC051546]|uniref:hypothetical protein n=1 Tax=Streptomyces sp. NPDC051546 TaxID=3365655 RepID=UPI0037A7DF48